jgi:tyrosine ammonia-lyase
MIAAPTLPEAPLGPIAPIAGARLTDASDLTHTSNGQSVDIGGDVTPRDIHDIALGERTVHLGAKAAARMAASHEVLTRMVNERRRIYGVTTGYGPLASHPVSPEHASVLQRNLVYHLCSGVGEPLSAVHTRAMIAARASSLACGYSGVGAPLFQRLLDCLTLDLVPVVPEMGTVGASGDLTPLAHVALTLMGQGEMWYRGARLPAGDALRAAGLAPMTFGHKEGIALVNGTSCMTGIAAVNAERARRAAFLAMRLAVLYAECLGGRLEAWDARFAVARPHPGQQRAHEALLQWATGSERLRANVQPPPVLDETHAVDGWLPEGELPQDPYTIRCVPQVIGAVLDVLRFHEDIVTTELRSATDNPLVFADEDAILHGGNFYGQHVAFASDALLMAVTKIAIHAERCVARLTDRAQNHGLPAFLHGGPDGVNSGFMGAQVTASALVAELRTRAIPASIQSVPTNANNQDVVTMGTIAARKAAGALDLVYHVLAVHALALAQAAELRGGEALHGFAPESRSLVQWVRTRHAHLHEDRPLSPDIQSLSTALATRDWAPRA